MMLFIVEKAVEITISCQKFEIDKVN